MGRAIQNVMDDCGLNQCPSGGNTTECQGGHDIVVIDTGIRRLLMGMPISMAVFNREGVYVAKNEVSTLGRKPSEVMGQNIRQFIPTEQHGLIEPLFTAVVDYRRKISDMHFDLIHKDGSIITVSLAAMPIWCDGAAYVLAFANRSHKLSTVECFAEGNLQSLYDIQRQLKDINDSVSIIRALIRHNL